MTTDRNIGQQDHVANAQGTSRVRSVNRQNVPQQPTHHNRQQD